MALSEVLDILTANPLLLGAIMAVIYNIAGYIASMLKIKALEGYQVTKLGETLVIFETLFLLLSQLAGLDVKYTAVFAIGAAIVISLKNKIGASAPA